MSIKQNGGVFGRNPTFNDVTIEGQLTFEGNIDIDSDITWEDGKKALFGDSGDLEIYHDSNNSYISESDATGSLFIKGTHIYLQNSAGQDALNLINGNAFLKSGGATKLATSSSGVDVTGDVSIGDGSASATRLVMGAGDDSKMFHNGADTYWMNDTGNIIIRNQSDDKDILLQTDDGAGGFTDYITVDGSETDVSLHFGGNAKLTTKSSGVDVTGTATMDGLTVNAGTPNVAATFTSSDDTVSLVLTDNDTTNKIHSSGTGLRFEISGSETGRFDSAGLDVTGTVTADGMTISGTAFAGMNIQAGASSLAAIDFGDSADSNIGGINYNNADDTLNLRSGNANRLTVASNGDVSIPSGDLTVVDTSGGNTTTPLLLQNGGGLNSVVELRLAPTAYPNEIGSVARWSAIRAINSAAGNATELAFVTNSASTDPVEAMRISSTQDVSIPNGDLTVGTGSAATGLTVENQRVLVQRAGEDTAIAFADNASGTPSSHCWAAGLDISDSNGFSIAYASNGLPSLTGSNVFGIDTSGNVSVPNGNLSVADGSTTLARTNGAPLEVNRSNDGILAYFKSGGIVRGNISISGSTTAYNTSSDYRLKEDWQPMSGATDRLKELNPVNFAWKSDGSRVDGFLAHEAQEVVPESVTGSKDAMQTEEYEVSPATGDIYTPEVVAVEGVEAVEYVAPVEAQDAVMGERQKMETVETGTYVNLAGETITETQEVGVTEEQVQTVVERQDIDGVMTEVEVEKTVSVPVMESYEVSPAVEAVEGVEAVEAVESVEGVAEVIHSANVEQPSELEDGQLWRETTAQVMGEREVPDYQGIDQAKLVPLLVATIQELEARITALES